MSEVNNNHEEIISIQKFLTANKIDCYKYHSSLDATVCNLPCYKAYITLEDDYKHLIIVNRKPNDKLIYVKESDPAIAD